MKIVYLHQYYNTPERGGPLRSWFLSQALVADGHEVHLITTYNGKNHKEEIHSGVHIYYLPIHYDNSMGFYRRIKSFLLFAIKSVFLTSKLDPDICFATSTPLTVGLTALLLKYTRSIPFIFEVRDLWPQAPVEIGVIKSRSAAKILYRYESLIYQEAQKIIGLSPPISAYIKRTTSSEKVVTLTNMSDCSFFQLNLEKPDYLVSRFQANEKMVISYIGAAGKANSLGSVIEAAKACEMIFPGKIKFLIAAEGKELEIIRKKSVQIPNIGILDYKNREQIKELLSISDFSIVSYLDLPVLKTSSPNKLFDSLAAGVPVISNIEGWWVKITEEAEAGIHFNQTEPKELAEKLSSFIDNPEQLRKYKINARKLAEQNFERKKIEKAFLSLFKDFPE